jgi:ArsR family transcriptional regulator, arsenate/arsenite/antimonite-responsive transcriptional repressor
MLNHASETADVALLSQVARALGHPKRIAILDALMQGVQCNCEISAQLGLADNLISHHMRVLEESGLVQSERDPQDRRWIYYSIDVEVLGRVRGTLGAFFDEARIQDRQLACGPSGSRACGPSQGSPCP